jgi:hypothetical protein
MKKIVLTFILFIHFMAKAQFAGAPFITPYPYITSNGTAIVSGYTCSSASTGTMTERIGVFGVSQTITVAVTTVGTYNISATSNGVTFAGTGTFSGTGNQSLLLTASGIPTTAGTTSFNLNTSPGCTFSRTMDIFVCGTTTVSFIYNGSIVTYGTVSSSGQCWLDRNLGATRVATSSTDANGYGGYFQWGRVADGHQILTSSTTNLVSTTNTPGNANFILASPDWISPQNNNLWQGANGINNVCPVGFRLPTIAELNAEKLSWSTNNSAGAFTSPLKLPVAGYRYIDNVWTNANQIGRYWSSTVSGNTVSCLEFGSTDNQTIIKNGLRSTGRSVRCIKN